MAKPYLTTGSRVPEPDRDESGRNETGNNEQPYDHAADDH